MKTEPRSTLMSRYLDPASSLGEIMFGLIMTLTFTLGAGIIIEDEGAEGARDLLIALIGCNIAWGVIDAAMYLMTELFTRGKRRRVAEAVRSAPDERGGVAVIANELDDLLEGVGDDAERQALYSRVAAKVRTAEIKPNRLTKADFLGAFTSFWLVVIASLPAAIPFLVWDDARFALRVSNAILLAFLFFCGYNWARYTLGNPWTAGLIFLAGGFALVAMAIALGG
ncbi:MAG TPA: VIT1/CCC1 transporter family protein [Steroidobacteraceae bacterium]|nr:VIT1/CCC1 transporter family protein [Steroidobacteraceae bacterium]